jgi:hypothetical protein
MVGATVLAANSPGKTSSLTIIPGDMASHPLVHPAV